MSVANNPFLEAGRDDLLRIMTAPTLGRTMLSIGVNFWARA